MRILIRAQMEHNKAFSPHDVLLKNLMGGNSGNWLYQYSLYRALTVDENTVIDIFNPTKQKVNAAFIDYVNQNYDVFVMPLANAFKNTFVEEMKALTRFLNSLTIPCVVPGVGIQAKNGRNFCESFEFSEESKEFIKAILGKSNIIGVRGEATAEFFKFLGFTEEQDYTVIGCPSLYTYGLHLPQVKELNYSPESKLLFSSKVEHESQHISSVFESFAKQHPNYFYAPQWLPDMINCFYGKPYRTNTDPLKERFFDKNKAVIFSSPYRWINFLKENVDFSIGTRIHGNVAAVLGGVPSFIMATDQRVSELASYHNIACVPVESVTEETRLADIIEQYDFTKVNQGHEERFNRFVDFLEKNNLPNVYSADRSVEKVYFDSVIENLDFSDNVFAFGSVSHEEQLERLDKVSCFYIDKLVESRSTMKEEINSRKEENKLLKESNKQLKEDKKQLKARRDELKEERAQLKETNKQLKEDKKQLKARRDELKEERAQLKETNKQLKEDKKQLKARRDELKEERKQLKETNKQLKEDKKQLKARRDELKAERSQLKEENKQLKSERNKLIDDKKNLTEDVKIYKSEITQLKKALADAESKKGLKGIFG